MKLFGSYTSPYVRQCRVVLLQSELPFEFVETDYRASAVGSPTKRVPYLEDDKVVLTDSTAIVCYLRRKVGQEPFGDVAECQRYFLADTALDTAVNLFLLEKDGVTPAASPYLGRQEARLESCLVALAANPLPVTEPVGDGVLRLACFLEWALFRKRISLEPYPALQTLLARMQAVPHFAETAPPAGL